MIVKDSTTNQVHNVSTEKKKKKLLKRLRSDASGAPERAPPVEKTSQVHDRRRCQRLTHLRGVVSHFFSHFFGLDSFQKKKKKLLFRNNKKEDLGEICFLFF